MSNLKFFLQLCDLQFEKHWILGKGTQNSDGKSCVGCVCGSCCSQLNTKTHNFCPHLMYLISESCYSFLWPCFHVHLYTSRLSVVVCHLFVFVF